MTANVTRQVNLQLVYAKSMLALASDKASANDLTIKALLNAALMQLEQALVWYLTELEANGKMDVTVKLMSLSEALERAETTLKTHIHYFELKNLAHTPRSWLFNLIAASEHARIIAKDDKLKNPLFESDINQSDLSASTDSAGAPLIKLVNDVTPDCNVEVMLEWCSSLQELLLRQRAHNEEY